MLPTGRTRAATRENQRNQRRLPRPIRPGDASRSKKTPLRIAVPSGVIRRPVRRPGDQSSCNHLAVKREGAARHVNPSGGGRISGVLVCVPLYFASTAFTTLADLI